VYGVGKDGVFRLSAVDGALSIMMLIFLPVYMLLICSNNSQVLKALICVSLQTACKSWGMALIAPSSLSRFLPDIAGTKYG
jgi:hypothetical protein